MNMPPKHRPAHRPHSERGSALAIVVMFLAAITVLLGSLLSGVNHSFARKHAAWREQVTRALAEAGIERAAAQLAEKAGAYTGENDVPIGDGYCSIRTTREKSSNAYRVVSVGELRDGGRVLRRSEAHARITMDGKRIVAIDRIDPNARPEDEP